MVHTHIIKSSLILIASLLCYSCTDEMEDGGYEFCNVYILDKSGVIDAQNTLVTFNKDGGSQIYTIVSPAKITIQPLDETNGITMTALDDYETYEWITTQGEKVDFVKQSIVVEASANNMGKRKNASYYVVAMIYNGYAAKFTINQSK